MDIKILVCRFLIAIVAGGIIGYEREIHNRPAGFRTHILVCVGATIISLIEVQMEFEQGLGPQSSNLLQISKGRLAAQVISGIGFLGAGTIIHSKNTIKGLTTAASLWVVACVGLAIGYGYIDIVFWGVSISILTLTFLNFLQKRFINKKNVRKIEILYKNKKNAIEFIESLFDEKDIKIRSLEFPIIQKDDFKNCKDDCYNSMIYTVNISNAIDMERLCMLLMVDKDIIDVQQKF